MRKKYLIVKVWCVHFLQLTGILPIVWYKCEIDLSKIRGKEWAKFFAKHAPKKYGYGSDHEMCGICGLCIPCGDCECEKTIVETCPLCGCYKTRDKVWHAPEAPTDSE